MRSLIRYVAYENMVNTNMATNFFTPEWSYENRNKPDKGREYFKAYLTALELTEESRKDELIRVKNLRPYPLGELEDHFVIAYDTFHEITGELESTKNYVIALPCLIQVAQIDNPPIPVAWFKRSFKTGLNPIISKKATLTTLEIDVRQQILSHVFRKRTRMERYFRSEIPFHEHLLTKEADRVFRLTNNVERVMGVVAPGYPLEWSTYKMFRALSDVIVDTFENYTLDPPYMTPEGTYQMAFHTKDSEWTIEPRRGDVIGIGAILRDNPYGRESLNWFPRALRLVCLNGATSPISLGGIRVKHRSFQGMVDGFIEGILKPHLDPITEEPINEFEAKLPLPLDRSEYFENHQLLYDHLASVMMARMLGNAGTLKERYLKAADFVIKDYEKALEMVCAKFDVSKQVQERLGEIATQDPTIPTPGEEEFTLYDLSNVFTTYSNAPISEEQRQKYSVVGGQIIANQRAWQEAITYASRS